MGMEGMQTHAVGRRVSVRLPIPNWPEVLQTVISFTPRPSDETPADIQNPRCPMTQDNVVYVESKDWTR